MKIEDLKTMNLDINFSSNVRERDVKIKIEPELKEKSKVTNEQIEKALKKLNESVDNIKSGIKFERESGLGKIIVKIYNLKTGEVIRRIPEEQVVKISEGLEDISGNIFDQKG